MSSHQLQDFPPHWDPPPRAVYDQKIELILEVMENIIERSPAPWVRNLYFAKFAQALVYFRPLARFDDEKFVTSTWPRTARLLAKMSGESTFLEENKESIETIRALVAQWRPTHATTAPTTAL